MNWESIFSFTVWKGFVSIYFMKAKFIIPYINCSKVQ